MELVGFGKRHAPFFTERRTRCRVQCLVAGNPGTLGGCDFFSFSCSESSESSKEHPSTSIAGVLRLRAINPALCSTSARRVAQDDGFVEGLESIWSDVRNTMEIEKITTSRETNLLPEV